MTQIIRVIDLETTGLPPDADVVEAACIDVLIDEKEADGFGWSTLVKPTRPISIEARAAHHISDEDAAQGYEWKGVKKTLSGKNLKLFCAHNANFEKEFFNPEGAKWIDTYKCALRLWPDAPKHTNQVLRYYLEGCDPGKAGMPPHRALPDCHVTVKVLINCLMLTDVEQLIQWSDEPPLLPRVPMGKHFGKPWGEVPTDYLEWASRQDFDEGVAFAVKMELQKRNAK